MTELTEEVMHEAVAGRDSTYDGQFVYGVITTGVYCLPSCTSRPARPENLRFFSTISAATAAGFRPCKRCQPRGDTTLVKRVEAVARFIESHAEERLTLGDLAKQMNLSPSHFQKVFKATLGVSPKTFQDSVRMNRLKGELREGKGVTDAILAVGFGSMSRVYGESVRELGMTPKAYRSGGAGEAIAYAFKESTLGPMLMAATEQGVCFVQFGENKEQLLNLLNSEFPKATIQESSAQNAEALNAWIAALDSHISCGAPRPELPLDLRGTAFQVKVWRFLLSVKEGEVISYRELAANIEKPKAIRAAASACAANKVGVLVPCHRVLRGDGSLGGYRWGVEIKRALLDMERSRNSTKV